MGALLTDAEALVAYAHWLSFLGELWLAPPGEEQEKGLAALAELFPEEREGLLQEPAASLRQPWFLHLRVGGPQALLPYESQHAGKSLEPQGTERMACVASLYRQAGFPLEPFTHEPPDHLGHELRFLAALARRQAELLTADDQAGAARVQGWLSGFRRDHLCSWLPAFVQHCQRVARHPFFPALARATAALVEADDG